MKDDFLLPRINMLVDAAAKCSTYSFMDDFSMYNYIKMAKQDKKKLYLSSRGELAAIK